MNNYENKLIEIKETQKELITSIKEAILDEEKLLNLNIQDLIEMLNYDETTVKKYEATLKAQILIEEFTHEIVNTNDIEEIKELRNRLNYYINKIKYEIKERNIPENEYNKYYEKATTLRKNISKYIRFLKREDNIKEIERLSSNIDNLNKDELLTLKKKIKLEKDYGRRNKIDESAKEKKEDNSFDLSKLFARYKKDQKNNNKTNIEFSFNSEQTETKEFKGYETLESYLYDKTASLKSRYLLKRKNIYSGNIIQNIGTLIKNVPIIKANKNTIKKMERETIYDRSPEFMGFIEYTRRDNSYIQNIKDAFKNSSIRDKAKLYLLEHKNCVEWIKSYCHSHHMKIDYAKKVY